MRVSMGMEEGAGSAEMNSAPLALREGGQGDETVLPGPRSPEAEGHPAGLPKGRCHLSFLLCVCVRKERK